MLTCVHARLISHWSWPQRAVEHRSRLSTQRVPTALVVSPLVPPLLPTGARHRMPCRCGTSPCSCHSQNSTSLPSGLQLPALLLFSSWVSAHWVRLHGCCSCCMCLPADAGTEGQEWQGTVPPLSTAARVHSTAFAVKPARGKV